MSIEPRRLLGLAFAAADLLIELDATGRITLALGAPHAVLGPNHQDLVGADWRDFVRDDDSEIIEAMLLMVDDGARRAVTPVRLKGQDRAVMIQARVLPDNSGRISCALTSTPMPRVGTERGGLHAREDFERLARDLTEAARVTGAQLELAMVDLAGLADAGPDAFKRVAGALRLETEGAGIATQLTAERFALLMRQGGDVRNLARRVTRAIAQGADTDQVTATAQAVPLDSLSPARLSRALHLALDDFIAEGLSGSSPGTLAEAMNRSVRRTLARAGELGAAVSQRRFTLAFQPVVKLSDGSLHHHEALIRFENAHNPFALVRMAEEFDLIEELDRAVVEQTVRRLKAERLDNSRIAVNISGRTITSPPFIQNVATLLRKDDRLRGRLLFEITESAAIDDLDLADQHVQVLRDLGSLVCLDDFGSGAASLNYLQKLRVDIVKIDGRYVRELVAGGRDAAVVAHIVNLCRDLEVKTVAEMVETVEVEEAVRAAGVDFGQGWLYGRPADRPEAVAPRPAPMLAAPRRTGTRDEWC